MVPGGHNAAASHVFRFHRADVASEAYNPEGAAPSSTYRFPFRDWSFDFIFLSSVFTHMLPDAVEHYLHEIARACSRPAASRSPVISCSATRRGKVSSRAAAS